MNLDTLKSALDTLTKRHSSDFFLNTRNILDGVFEGDLLTVAKVYQKFLIQEIEIFGVCGAAISNARKKTFRVFIKPVVKDLVNPCPRCNGTGVMPFKHIANGTCFKCSGTGSNKK